MTDAIATAPTDAGPLTAILADPDKLRDLPVETVERLYALHERDQAKRAEREFSAGLVQVRQTMPMVPKNGWNSHTKSAYAKLDDVYRALVPVATGLGFSWSTSGGDGAPAGLVRGVMTLRHAGGHTERHQMDAPLDETGPSGTRNKSALHGTFSTYTYLERNLVVRVFGIQTGKDDDGNRGAGMDTPALDGPVTPEQGDIIEDLLARTKTDSALFLKWLKAVSVADIPKHDFKRAKRALEKRLP